MNLFCIIWRFLDNMFTLIKSRKFMKVPDAFKVNQDHEGQTKGKSSKRYFVYSMPYDVAILE